MIDYMHARQTSSLLNLIFRLFSVYTYSEKQLVVSVQQVGFPVGVEENANYHLQSLHNDSVSCFSFFLRDH